jgi:hypothetical protein
MDHRPAFLGRGRGRGNREQRPSSQQRSSFKNGEKSQKTTSAWNSGAPVLTREKHDVDTVKASNLSDRHKKVEEIRQAAANFADDPYLSSSDSDEDINDSEILRTTLTTYQGL